MQWKRFRQNIVDSRDAFGATKATMGGRFIQELV